MEGRTTTPHHPTPHSTSGVAGFDDGLNIASIPGTCVSAPLNIGVGRQQSAECEVPPRDHAEESDH